MDERQRTIVITGGTSDRPAGMLTRIVAGVLSVVVLVVAAFFGLFLFLAALGLVVIFGTVFAVRMWWYQRKLR